MRYCILIALLFISLPASAQNGAAPPTAGTIERSQDMLRQDEDLRQEIGQEEQFFIDKIDIKGASQLSEKEINGIVAPFQGNWLTKKDFQQIIDLLKAAYVKKRFDTSRLTITYEIKKPGTLTVILTLNEVKGKNIKTP